MITQVNGLYDDYAENGHRRNLSITHGMLIEV